MKCSKEQAEAVVRLSQYREWNTFLSMLGEHAETLNRVLIMKDDINADIKRGELRTMVQLTDAIAEAPGLIEAHNKPKT